jgi:hypothetical protein
MQNLDAIALREREVMSGSVIPARAFRTARRSFPGSRLRLACEEQP